MTIGSKNKLTFQLSEEQQRSLKPLLDQTGQLDIVGTIKDGKLAVSFMACQAAFTTDLRFDKKTGSN